MIPVIQRISRKSPSISPLKEETPSGNRIQNGTAPASFASRTEPSARARVRSAFPFLTAEALPLEGEIRGLRLGSGDRDVLVLGTIFLLPGLDHVAAGGKTLDLKGPLV